MHKFSNILRLRHEHTFRFDAQVVRHHKALECCRVGMSSQKRLPYLRFVGENICLEVLSLHHREQRKESERGERSRLQELHKISKQYVLCASHSGGCGFR